MIEYDHWQDVKPGDWVWPNFTPEEMACKGTGRLRLAPGLMSRLQALRDLVGPLPVTSGYRSPEHNAKVSATGRTGPHTKGLAVDIKIAGERAHELLRAAFAAGWTGIGVCQHGDPSRRMIHLDLCRNSQDCPRPRVWSYPWSSPR